MFSSSQGLLLDFNPRSGKGGKHAASTPAPDGLATVDEAPPVRRLTAGEIHRVSLQWKARGRAGDETALRVAEALEGVARRRAIESRPKPLAVLARHISGWMGLSNSARTH